MKSDFCLSPVFMLQIPFKANRILNVILIGIFLIVLRVWYLAVVQHDQKIDESRKPQRKQVTEAAKRGTIRDRFNVPLAFNKMQYNVSILYSQLKQIPIVAWEIDQEGHRVKRSKRKEYITALAQLLANELCLDCERIEDLIHAKASFYNQIPFIIKEDVSEREYYRLKMLEKDWLGINVQRVPRRHYAYGKIASDIIGYMGAINKQEYESIIREMKALGAYLESVERGDESLLPEGFATIEQVHSRLENLHELAYTINDSIGKAGVEGRFESSLRGYRGKREYYSDARGNFLRELPGTREPLSGKRILLTISLELQQYAEELLIANEKIRQTRLSHLNVVKRTILADKDPWIKGGAIVAMDPNNGELLAMASHPRFDPNDFIPSGDSDERKQKRSHIHKWLENETYLAGVWDQQYALEREAFNRKKNVMYSEEMFLTWNNYLELILSQESPLKSGILLHGTINDAIVVQKHLEKIMNLIPDIAIYPLFNVLYRAEMHTSYGKKATEAEVADIEKQQHQIKEHKEVLDRYVGNLQQTYDQVLLIDLMRVAVSSESFDDELLAAMGKQSLAKYKENGAAMGVIQDVVKNMAKTLFHEIDFKEWRKLHEKEYLKQMRAKEKASHHYAKPYIDYFDSVENEQFQLFWQTYCWQLIGSFLNLKTKVSDDGLVQDFSLSKYIEYFNNWSLEIAQGAHSSTEWMNAYKTIQKTIQVLPCDVAISYMKTFRRFSSLNRRLLGNYRHLRKNPDYTQEEKHLAAAFYPRYGYGYGRSQAYRQAATQGSLFKLVTAYESLVQRYRYLESTGQGFADLNPLQMIDQIFYKGKDLYLGYDSNNQPLPRHYKGGCLPRSASSMLGQIDLLRALETSSNPYFALIAGDVLESPLDLARAARQFSFGSKTGIDLPGEISGKVPEDLDVNRTGLYAFSIGQHTLVTTPLQTTVMLSAFANGGKIFKPKIIQMMVGKDSSTRKTIIDGFNPVVQRQIFLPKEIRKMLLDGMCRVVARSHSEQLSGLSRLYHNDPKAIADYIELKHRFLGKTSTAESVEYIDLDLVTGTNLYTHVWFGGISYDQDVVDKKEHRFLLRDSFGNPELIVVVYLRYGGFGKEAGPIAAQIAKKWKEIKAKHQL